MLGHIRNGASRVLPAIYISILVSTYCTGFDQHRGLQQLYARSSAQNRSQPTFKGTAHLKTPVAVVTRKERYECYRTAENKVKRSGV